MTTPEGEQHVIVAAQHILRALGTTKNLTDDFRRALIKIDAHLSAMTSVAGSIGGGVFKEVEERLTCANRKIMQLESSPSPVWDSPTKGSEYLQAVQEILAVKNSLEVASANENFKLRELAYRAHCALHTAMTRLQEELCQILVQNKQFFDPQFVSFRSCAEDLTFDESFVSLEAVDHEESESQERDNTGRESVEYVVDLVNLQVLPNIKSIANVMFAADYGHEFCEAFVGSRRDALDEYLSIMELEKLSIEDVLRLDWESLNSNIKKWVWFMKKFIRIYLASEKRLYDQILRDHGCGNLSCFAEIAKSSLFRLLNFGKAVAMGPHRPEKLHRLLDMYEVLTNLQPDINSLFFEESGSFVRTEFQELLKQLGGSVWVAFLQFRNAIASDASPHPVPGGAIHPLSRYVMNYLRLLTVYSGTLGSLLGDQDVKNLYTAELYGGQECSCSPSCSVGCYFLLIASTLELKLVEKSKLYNDSSLEHIFLMNNIHYMVQKVMRSELRIFFGDQWIRRHMGKYQQHATSYWRVTWNSVVSLLRDDRKTCYRERYRRFTIAFDDVYKRQMQLYIPNQALREDQQISGSLTVIHAYQYYVGAHTDDEFLKYSVEDLEKLFLALFAEPPKLPRASRKR